MPKPVNAPASYVPQQAIAFGGAGVSAIGVDRTQPLPVESGAEASVVAPIAAGVPLSAAIDLDRQRLHRVFVPAGWTAAALSFQTSVDGLAWFDLYDPDGEVTLAATIVAAGRAIVVDAGVFFGIRWLRLRSGTSGAPVNQQAAAAVTLATVAR